MSDKQTRFIDISRDICHARNKFDDTSERLGWYCPEEMSWILAAFVVVIDAIDNAAPTTRPL